MPELDGKVAIVTGAGRLRGIGRAAAVALARLGANVVVTGTGRSPENYPQYEKDAGWNDIVDVTVFLTDMKKDFPTFNKLYAEYFAGEGKPNPTRTTIEVNCLPTPIAVELKVIAAVTA